MIVDSISLFHPGPRQILVQSAVTTRESVAVIVLSPVSAETLRANELIESRIGLHMQRAFARYHSDLDRMCEICVGDLRTLQRRLFAIVSDTAVAVQTARPNSGTLAALHQQVGPRRGLDKLIFGRRTP